MTAPMTTGSSVHHQWERRTGERVAILGAITLVVLSLPVRRDGLRKLAIRSVRRFATPLEGGEQRDPRKTTHSVEEVQCGV